MKDYYAILGLRPEATAADIRAAYRRRAKDRHPDAGGPGSEAFHELHEAYELLNDPARRRQYDRRRASAHPPRPEPARSAAAQSAAPEPLIPPEPLGYARRESQIGMADSPPDFVLFLNAREAAAGGRLRLDLDVLAYCRVCFGSGTVGPFLCPRCAGRGRVPVRYPLEVSLPGNLYDRDRLRLYVGGETLDILCRII